jgi:hypothetical protein
MQSNNGFSLNLNIPDYQAPDILMVVHLDDNFVQSRIDSITGLVDLPATKLQDILNITSNFEKKTNYEHYGYILEGMNDLVSLILRIRKRISEYLIVKPKIKIFMMNYYGADNNNKSIFSPYSSNMINIENMADVLERNETQAKNFLRYLYNMGFITNQNLSIELTGVYRYACVNSIDRHLTAVINSKELNITKYITKDLTL